MYLSILRLWIHERSEWSVRCSTDSYGRYTYIRVSTTALRKREVKIRHSQLPIASIPNSLQPQNFRSCLSYSVCVPKMRHKSDSGNISTSQVNVEKSKLKKGAGRVNGGLRRTGHRESGTACPIVKCARAPPSA